MIKLTKKIGNPMTIIAIFATLSEASAAVSLPFLDNDEREIYIWFLISFPFYLLFLFFVTLNFNYRSLYSPSDFDKDEHFLKAMDVVTPQKNNASRTDTCHISPCGAQAPPDELERQAAPSVEPQMHSPDLLKSLHIVDTRWMKNKLEFHTMLKNLQKTQKRQAGVILFLTVTATETFVKESVLKLSRQGRKRSTANCCVTYNLNSQGMVVLDQGR
ncbi:hypothetical protein [Pseudomonas sp. NPDC089569]|uniref:hypothetical protein n=1 Tax=Pseudomonas sp. NPDC089569 TaxID=3390722 RepID=UPI003D024F37